MDCITCQVDNLGALYVDLGRDEVDDAFIHLYFRLGEDRFNSIQLLWMGVDESLGETIAATIGATDQGPTRIVGSKEVELAWLIEEYGREVKMLEFEMRGCRGEKTKYQVCEAIALERLRDVVFHALPNLSNGALIAIVRSAKSAPWGLCKKAQDLLDARKRAHSIL